MPNEKRILPLPYLSLNSSGPIVKKSLNEISTGIRYISALTTVKKIKIFTRGIASPKIRYINAPPRKYKHGLPKYHMSLRLRARPNSITPISAPNRKIKKNNNKNIGCNFILKPNFASKAKARQKNKTNANSLEKNISTKNIAHKKSETRYKGMLDFRIIMFTSHH